MNEQKQNSKPLISLVMIVLTSFIGVAAVLATLWWIMIVMGRDGLHAMWFCYIIVPFVGLSSFLFGVIPCAILYFRRKRPLDRVSLWISVVSFGSIVS